MASDYIIRLKCPYGDRDQSLILENREESLQQILDTPWDFECPVHGVQRELPLGGEQKKSESGPRPQKNTAKIASRAAPQPRSGKRVSLHVPVLVYGWSKEEGSFREETTTILVNSGGGLLGLRSRVALGDTIFIKNKTTQQERECRLVHIARGLNGKLQVGAAFKHPAPHFWRVHRREARILREVRVNVRGFDRDGHPFVQSTYAIDISRHGACIEGIGYLTGPGDTVEVKRHLRAARYRVIWIGQIGTPQAGRAGVFALEPDKNIWGAILS